MASSDNHHGQEKIKQSKRSSSRHAVLQGLLMGGGNLHQLAGVGVFPRGRTQADCFIARLDVQGECIRLGEDHQGLYSKLSATPSYTARNLASIGNEDLSDRHDGGTSWKLRGSMFQSLPACCDRALWYWSLSLSHVQC